MITLPNTVFDPAAGAHGRWSRDRVGKHAGVPSKGVAMVRHINLLPHMTVPENCTLGQIMTH